MRKGLWLFITSMIFCLGLSGFCAEESAPPPAEQGFLKLGENISIELISPDRGTLMLTAENGRVELPQGRYRLESWTLERKDDSGYTWKLSGDVNTARMIDVGPEPADLSIQTEPIHCDLQIYPGPVSMNFTLGLTGPSGERLRVSGDAPGVKADQLPRPTFVLYTEDKSYQKSYDFQSQCCGNFRFNWTPPVDVAGPFFLDIRVDGPFKTDFVPRNISEMHEQAIADQQAQHARNIKQLYILGLCYIIALAVIVGVLIGFRRSIAAAMQKGLATRGTRRLVLLLGILVLLMLLDPLLLLINDRANLEKVIFQCGIVAALILALAVLVWIIRSVRTRWPFVTIMLYGLFFVLLLMPIIFMVFTGFGKPNTDLSDFDLDDWFDFYGELISFSEPAVFVAWAIILAIFAAQASLLIIPIRIEHQRPKRRRGIWWTAIVAALLYTVLLFFAGLSVMAAVWGDDIFEPVFWVLVGILPINWIGWSIVFGLVSRSMGPENFVRRLMDWLIRGSILELLIAVPSHIIVRHRDVCCAHDLTAAGLTSGLAVMFFAFGPGLYFLYADRIRRKMPNFQQTHEEQSSETKPSPEVE